MASKCGNVQKVFVLVNQKETATESPAPVTGINITDKAAERILHFLKIENKDSQAFGLKVSVVKDGCSGNSYSMDIAPLDPAKEAGDKIFQKDGAIVIIDKLSYMFVIGSTLDYVESLLMSGFQLNNPNVKKSCSCGSSVAF